MTGHERDQQNQAVDTFLPAAATEPGSIAIRWAGGAMTWGVLEQRGRQFANRLEELGLRQGDRVATMAFNRPEWVVTLVGNMLAGMRHVPINWHLTTEEVAYLLGDSEARVLVVDPEHEAVGRAAAAHAGVDHVLVAGPDLDRWLAAASSARPLTGERAGALLLYTSGTTGRPKGVLRAGQPPRVDQVMPDYRRLGHTWRMTDGGVHLVACPMYHSTPQVMMLMCLALGQSLVLMTSFDAAEALRLIEEHRVTATHLVPTQLVRLLRLPAQERARYDLSSLTGVWHGAAPCPHWLKQAVIDWLGPIVIEYFGSSEGTGPLIATSEEWLARPGTVGRPTPPLTVEAVDASGETLPRGSVGTLYFNRPEGPPSYLGAPEKTAAMRLADGRFTVGDVGWVDDDGFVFLADRQVDTIISGGVNIYPSEIEAVLSQHPSVADCAVFGIPDEEWGEQVKAAVQLVPGGAARESDLIEWCRAHIAGYKCPRSIDFHDELPREPSGKMKKRVLRDPYWEHTGRLI